MATKKQHFMPRFYLRHFANADGRLCVYRRECGDIFTTIPENVCAENYLYEVGRKNKNAMGERPKALRNYIENRLSSAENRLAPLYEQLITCCRERDFASQRFIDSRLSASILAANLIVRHPRLLEVDRAGAHELTEAFLAHNDLNNSERQSLDQLGAGDNLDMISEAAIMQTLLFSDSPETPFNRICNSFCEKKMTILEAPVGMGFITTSLPLFFEGIDEKAYAFETAYMPLSKKYAALYSSHYPVAHYIKASIGQVVEFNSALLSYGDIWDVAMASAQGHLDVAIRQWTATAI